MDGIIQRAKELSSILKEHDTVHIVTHIDADGLTAGSIAATTMQRLRKPYTIEFIKQIDKHTIDDLEKHHDDLVWFTDLGSSIAKEKTSFPKIITDHHVCEKTSDFPFHLNPHLFDVDGSYMISGAGVSYLVAKEISKTNMDLSMLAVVGAVGDLQQRRHRSLVGLNKDIVQDGITTGMVEEITDVQYFGRETRPVYKLLQYATDPVIPGVSGLESNSLSFLKDLSIPLKEGKRWRRWIDLNHDERQVILSEIARRLLSKGFGHQQVERLIGKVYLLPNELLGSELHDAKEYATLLNSTARYGEYEIGLEVCLGNRKKALSSARSLLQGHRHNLVEGLQCAKTEGIHIREYVQYFHARKGIRDTIVGIVANMLLNDTETRNDLPLIGFAEKNDDEVKASARTTQDLVEKGIDLSKIIKHAAKTVNGVGGGHSIAAGATIPKGKEEEFLTAFENEVKTQLSI
jgi:single-stranded-DNA-specific exonuclease